MKAGIEFEQVVGEICREFDPGADVQQGVWEEGPDGRRNLDVVVTGNVEGQRRRIHIECKDYNPARGPIGIEYVDAIESKHRDMNIDVSVLCSNAGFTSGAISKAKRLNIGLIAVLRENDDRVRFEVVDEAYCRRFKIDGTYNFSFGYPQGRPVLGAGTFILHMGRPVVNWLIARFSQVLLANLVVSGKLRMQYRFIRPIQVRHAETRKKSRIDSCMIEFSFTGKWLRYETRISTESGFYDWLQRAVRVGPGKAFSVSWSGVPVGVGGTEIYEPPRHLFPNWPYAFGYRVDGVALQPLCEFENMAMPSPEEIPDLAPLIVPADLELRCPDLQEDQFYPAK
jgi:hypothetical protein